MSGCVLYIDVVTLCEHLVREHGFDAEQILHVLDKPWKWDDEMESLRQLGTAYPEDTRTEG